MKNAKKTATLLLEDGSAHVGVSFGATEPRAGELVFNTAMTGYQEALSDPSYSGQILCFTSPHIGVVGVNEEDDESQRIHASAVVVRDYPECYSNWRAQRSLDECLAQHGVAGISGVDTRCLTRLLRDKGTMRAVVYADEADAQAARELLAATPDLSGVDLAKAVTADKAYDWDAGLHVLAASDAPQNPEWHVVAYDFGVKRNILRHLTHNGCRLTVVPAKTPAADVLRQKPDGVFLSNGPGDPEPCDYAIAAIRELLAANTPVFGICLGHQLLGLACGAKTRKMKFGHHGANHPVLDLESKRVFITSQNHNFCIDEESLPDELTVTHRSLFDDSVQGIRHKTAPAFGFQGHPEASPGPHDIAPIFQSFTEMMRHAKTN